MAKGFEKLDGSKARLREVMSISGLEGAGKTSFALTAPSPIYAFDFDQNLDPLVGPWQAANPGKELYAKQYRLKPFASITEQKAMYSQFLHDIDEVTGDLVDGGTVLIDTGTHVWQLIQAIDIEEIRATRVGKPNEDKVYPFDYARANKHMEDVVARLKDNPRLNVVLTHRMKEQYDAKGSGTGMYIPQGYKGIPYLATVNARLSKNTAHKRFLTIDKCTPNTYIEGMVLEDATWDMLIALVG